MPQHHETPSPVTRREQLFDARGPQRGLECAACPQLGAPLLTPVVKVQAAAHDDATVAFLVAQSLPERQVLEVKARRKSEEDEVVKRRKLEEQVARLMPPDDECLSLGIARLHHCRDGPWVACGDGQATLRRRRDSGRVRFEMLSLEDSRSRR